MRHPGIQKAFQIVPHRVHEALRPHRFCKQKTLDHVEAKLARGNEIGVGLDTNRSGAELTGRPDDMAAERPLGTVMRTTGDQFRLDLDFNKWKISQLQERGPLIAKPVNRDGGLAESCLLGEVARRREIAADFATVNLENESFESRMIGQLATQKFKSRRIVEKRDRQVDR